MYRSYIAQKKYAVVLDEVGSTSPVEVQAVKVLAEYFHNSTKRYAAADLILSFRTFLQRFNSKAS